MYQIQYKLPGEKFWQNWIEYSDGKYYTPEFAGSQDAINFVKDQNEPEWDYRRIEKIGKFILPDNIFSRMITKWKNEKILASI
jgi:hypothetical protein